MIIIKISVTLMHKKCKAYRGDHLSTNYLDTISHLEIGEDKIN